MKQRHAANYGVICGFCFCSACSVWGLCENGIPLTPMFFHWMSKDDGACEFLVLKLSWSKWWPGFSKVLRFLGGDSSLIGGV